MPATHSNGTNYEIAVSTTDQLLLARGLWGGKVLVQVDSKNIGGYEENSTVAVGLLPKGAKFLFGIIYHNGLGANTTLSLGYGTNYNEFLNGGSAGATAGTLYATLGIGTEMTSDTTIKLKLGGANAGANKVVNTAIFYSLD